jgi:hypothetical protein
MRSWELPWAGKSSPVVASILEKNQAEWCSELRSVRAEITVRENRAG